MVGIVIVSHSQKLAEDIVDLAHLMADDCPMRPAGGMADGGFGTSYDKIESAIEDIYTDDGVIILMDLGSAVMTTELVVDDMKDDDKIVEMVDCPIVEGAIAASVVASGGGSIEDVIEAAKSARDMEKF